MELKRGHFGIRRDSQLAQYDGARRARLLRTLTGGRLFNLRETRTFLALITGHVRLGPMSRCGFDLNELHAEIQRAFHVDYGTLLTLLRSKLEGNFFSITNR